MNTPHSHPSVCADAAASASAWVKRWAPLIPDGASVLDVACGSGRHMAYFQSRGCGVTGLELDPQAVQQCRAYGRVVQADLENQPWPLPGETFDALVVTRYLWRPLFPALLAALKPSGILIYETFAHGNETVGRPTRPQFLLQPGELLQVCNELEIIAYENGFLAHPDRFIQRICAAKPASNPSPALQKRRLLSVE